jgi:hypothetical protein
MLPLCAQQPPPLPIPPASHQIYKQLVVTYFDETQSEPEPCTLQFHAVSNNSIPDA